MSEEIQLIHSSLDFDLDEFDIQPPTTEPKYLYVYNHITLGQIFYKKPVGHPTEYIGKIKLEVDE